MSTRDYLGVTYEEIFVNVSNSSGPWDGLTEETGYKKLFDAIDASTAKTEAIAFVCSGGDDIYNEGEGGSFETTDIPGATHILFQGDGVGTSWKANEGGYRLDNLKPGTAAITPRFRVDNGCIMHFVQMWARSTDSYEFLATIAGGEAGACVVDRCFLIQPGGGGGTWYHPFQSFGGRYEIHNSIVLTNNRSSTSPQHGGMRINSAAPDSAATIAKVRNTLWWGLPGGSQEAALFEGRRAANPVQQCDLNIHYGRTDTNWASPISGTGTPNKYWNHSTGNMASHDDVYLSVQVARATMAAWYPDYDTTDYDLTMDLSAAGAVDVIGSGPSTTGAHASDYMVSIDGFDRTAKPNFDRGPQYFPFAGPFQAVYVVTADDVTNSRDQVIEWCGYDGGNTVEEGSAISYAGYTVAGEKFSIAMSAQGYYIVDSQLAPGESIDITIRYYLRRPADPDWDDPSWDTTPPLERRVTLQAPA